MRRPVGLPGQRHDGRPARARHALLARVLRVSPVPFLISQILASNIGGTATLIGDPPNILIGSAAGLGFVDFLANMAPDRPGDPRRLHPGDPRSCSRGDLAVHDDVRDAVLALDEREVLTDVRLLRVSLIVIGATIVGFVVATPLGLEAGTIALLGAAVLLLLVRARRRVGPARGRVADAVLLRRPVHARRGRRPRRHHRRLAAGPHRPDRRRPDRDDDRAALAVRASPRRSSTTSRTPPR